MFNEKVWKDGEKLTADYLKKNKYNIVYLNYNCKIAELDIVSVLTKKVQKSLIKNEIKCKIINFKDKISKKMFLLSMKNKIKNLTDLLVITEVKSRTTNKFGVGLEAISSEKIHKMQLGAEMLLKEPRFKDMQIRFDVASVDGGDLTYIENAF